MKQIVCFILDGDMGFRQILIILMAFSIGSLAAIWFYALGHNTQGKSEIISGKAMIGGPFNLISHEGKEISNNDFPGQYLLVYFGYSYCPDICPTDLQKITRAMEILGAKAKQVQPLFITIDPERDGVTQMKSYVDHFHPKLVGLTGRTQQIKSVTKAYKVYAKKVVDDNSRADYLMDHTALTYLMGPNGEFIKHFAYGTGPEKMAADISKELK